MKSGGSIVFAVGLSIFLALLGSVFPMSIQLSWLRPEWVCLVVVYWLLKAPHMFGIGIAWGIGFLQDIVEDGVWGANALALAVVAYICQMSYRRLRTYGIAQQTLWVFVLVGVHQLFVNWVHSMDGYSIPARMMILSTAISAAMWPVMVLLLRWSPRVSH